MMGLFFLPEIERRRTEGSLPTNFVLVAAQAIIFPDGRPQVIRLNDEVSIEVIIKKGVDMNVADFWPLRAEVEGMMLREVDHLDCGHVTIVHFRDGFQLSFDFQYNKKICRQHLLVAKEFLNTAKIALDNCWNNSFIDNAFSSAELMAKANLLIEGHKFIGGQSSHKTIKSAYNLRFKNSEMDFEVERRKLFNRLSDARKSARYLEGERNIDTTELESIYLAMIAMYKELDERIRPVI